MAENAKLTYWVRNQNISWTPEAEIILGQHVEAFGMDKSLQTVLRIRLWQ